ncbi:uncharacterized protein [Labrus bergylta]|uniref:uncharacterized protein n=1 Tax=Labrus bergylta TaxID=56723 RepID=UPI0033139939
MARRGRPASESYQSVCYSGSSSASLSSAAEIVGLDDEDDRAPIFSLSKSSMDMVMVSGLPYKRDPAWARTDLRRSSSTNTHSEQNSVTLQQLHPQMWQHINATNSHQLPLTAQNVDMHSPPVLSERWIANMQRWSGCSASTHSRSSTPDTIVWKEGHSRPSSLTQITSWSGAPDSPPVFKPTSSAATHSPSPLIAPLQAPTLTSPSLLTLNTQQRKDALETLHSPSPPRSPLQASTSSPLPSNSPDLQHLTGPKDEGFLENNVLSFTFPSPIPSSVCIAEGDATSDAGCLDDVIEALQSPGNAQFLERGGGRSPVQMLSGSCLSLFSPGGMRLSESGEVRSPVQHFGYVKPDFCPSPDKHSPGDTQLSESGEISSPVQMCGYLEPPSQAEGQESESKPPVCRLQLPWQPVQSFSTGRERRSPLVSSLSDSRLGECCRCNVNMRDGLTNAPKGEVFRVGGTPTSKLRLVDAAVQTISPIGSFWDLRRNTSNSNMDSHSLLGSPPGSRLNLISSVGSNSNLVSPSSSMFPVSSEEEEEESQEDDPAWEINSPSSHNPERRRSCLKMQGEKRDKLHRRSSMKQVQWDEEGMTWDIHGAAVDPEVLSTAIRKHLELKNSPQLAKKPAKKKKKAPKPPLISNVVKAMTPELNPPALIISSACMVEPESEDLPEAEKEGPVAEKGAGAKEETAEAPRRISRAEAVDAEEDEEVYGGEGSGQPKSPSHSSGQSRRRNVIRSLRPGWCGGSRKADD